MRQHRRFEVGRPRAPGRGLVVAPALLLAVLLAAACLGPIRELYPPRAGEASVTVHVVGHGWHSAIMIRRDDIPTEAWPESALFPMARFLEVGWGDRAFYESPDAGIVLAFKAAFASEASVLHVAAFDRPAFQSFPHAEIIAIELSLHGMESLSRFVSRAYLRDPTGQPIDMGPGLYHDSRFYAATGRYSLVNTCNNWIAEALLAGGCPITPMWAVTTGNLLLQAERCNAR